MSGPGRGVSAAKRDGSLRRRDCGGPPPWRHDIVTKTPWNETSQQGHVVRVLWAPACRAAIPMWGM